MSTRPFPAFLGRGWSFPIGAAGEAEVALCEGDEDVRQAILLILETKKGERVMRPDFGSGLERLVFEPLSSTLMSRVRKQVEDALVSFEPRIDLASVTVSDDPRARNTLRIEIRYLVRATNTFYNLVYPFYLAERRP